MFQILILLNFVLFQNFDQINFINFKDYFPNFSMLDLNSYHCIQINL